MMHFRLWSNTVNRLFTNYYPSKRQCNVKFVSTKLWLMWHLKFVYIPVEFCWGEIDKGVVYFKIKFQSKLTSEFFFGGYHRKSGKFLVKALQRYIEPLTRKYFRRKCERNSRVSDHFTIETNFASDGDDQKRADIQYNGACRKMKFCSKFPFRAFRLIGCRGAGRCLSALPFLFQGKLF